MPHRPLKLIRASAGSGKTFSLTAHYLVLLFIYPTKYREILAVTFTNKATAEMKHRILGALRELADSRVIEPKFRFIIRENYPELSDPAIRERAAVIYRNIIHDYSRFAVSTIDGFVQQVIRSFSFELNLESGYRLELNEQKVKDELARGLNMRMEHDPQLLEWVTSLAIDRINDGKDWNYERALDGIAGEIFKERYFPFQEAMRLMGDDKGDEFSRLKQFLATETETFKRGILEKAAAARQIFEHSGVLPDELANKSRHPVYKLAKLAGGDLSHWPAISGLANDFSGWPNKALKSAGNVEALFAAISPALRELAEEYDTGISAYETYTAISRNTPYLRLMQEMAGLVSEYRTRNRALLISDAQYLLKGITGSGADELSFIWEKTGNRFQHFLFDEFQDTSGFQWDNFLPLVKNALASHEEGAYPGHLVVGDVKQSIYRWRNGDWRILHQKLSADLGTHLVSEHSLEFNRRSSRNIIDFNNFLYDTLPGILQQQLNAEFAGAAIDPALAGRYREVIEQSYAGSFQQSTEDTPAGGEINVELIPRTKDGGDDPATLALQRTGDRIRTLLEQGYCLRDICVLVKRNSEGEDVIRHLLNRQPELSAAAGKTFQLISGESLRIANNPCVQLIVGTIRLLTTREQEQGIARALCARLFYEVHHPESAEIAFSPADWMRIAREPLSGLVGLLPESLCRGWQDLLHMPVTSLMEKLVDWYGLNKLEGHLPYVLALRDLVASFSVAGDEGLYAFLAWWEDEGSRKSLPGVTGQDAVTVMTVHKSKGLEFAAVIVPFGNWELNQHSGFLKKILWVDAARGGFGRFGALPVDYSPALKNTVFAESYFEELLFNYMDTLNTLYVATTRAKDNLTLFFPQKGNSSYDLYTVFAALLAPEGTADSAYVVQENKMVSGEPGTRAAVSEGPDAYGVGLAEYIVRNPSGASFARRADDSVWYNDTQRKGTALHKILSTARGTADLEPLIRQSVEEGDLLDRERTEIHQAALAVFEHADIGGWFTAAQQVISEKTILGEDGAADRPDKIFVFGDTAIVLDFKFGAERASHQHQIRNYRDLLLEMGYADVASYLWYAQTNTLRKVE